MDSLKKQLMLLNKSKLIDCILNNFPEKNKNKIVSMPVITEYKSILTMSYKPVTMSDKRFDQIYDKILLSYPNSCVLYINEVINEKLEDAFMKRFGSIPNAQILQLFHGTTNNIIDVIAQNGFDPTFNKSAAYGYGVYFAKDANYSKDYMKSNEEVTYMFLADVIVGRLARGAQRIPGVNPVYNWDNNVDNYTIPKIYTTPYADGAYPRYIIAFHKNAK